MRTLGRLIVCVFVFQMTVSMAAAGSDPEKYVRGILEENVHPGEPGKDEWIRMYCERTGVPLDEIGRILVRLIEDKSLESRIRSDAIWIVGNLHFREALPVLKNSTRSEKKSIRWSAICAIVRIGGDGLISFAREVVSDHKQYSGFDRFTLYDQLSYYLRDTSSREAGKVREDVRQFFSDAAGTETKSSCLQVIDRELGNADEQYGMSYEREEVLKKLEDSKAERYKKYASEQLERLRRLPKEKRTRVRIGKSTEE